jgi:hypothetical protein
MASVTAKSLALSTVLPLGEPSAERHSGTESKSPTTSDEKGLKSCAQAVSDLRSGRYVSVLKRCPLFLKLVSLGSCRTESLVKEAKAYMSNATSERELAALTTAASCLSLFVQLNFTGPPIDIDALVPKSLSDEAAVELVLSGEDVNPNARAEFVLLAAKIILSDCRGGFRTLDFVAKWWLGRCCAIHQSLLSVNVAEIRELACATWEALEKRGGEGMAELRARVMLEANYVHSGYWDQKRAGSCISKAEMATKVSVLYLLS